MRTLARRLGVAPNAVYSHVASKADLLDALLDDLLAEVTPPDPGGPGSRWPGSRTS
jgi:AcrR family transcriptional regulator